MLFFPRFLAVGFFPFCVLFCHSLVPLESFKSHYTDSMCLICFCTSFKAKILRMEMNVMYLQIKLLIKFLMFRSPYKGNNEEKVYFRVCIFLVCHRDFLYLQGNYQGKKMLYFVHQKAEDYCMCAFMRACVCLREEGRYKEWEEKGLNFCNSSMMHLVFSLAVTKASLWRRVSSYMAKSCICLKECRVSICDSSLQVHLLAPSVVYHSLTHSNR